ncbi:SURF1 family protein [Allopusillimonas ginsengisoli]|uniref:SURF1 family protein n=1 Tax=Allopusillimonas ginsengisoli TaxID=453575 RepID=UPI0010C1B7D8|nr:SURF1 family protein [Allopusillimonas ginsengisoli]
MPHSVPTPLRACAPSGTPARRTWVLALWVVIAILVFTSFFALGVWQVQRMYWKHNLIARVSHRIHAPPVAAPAPEQWAGITPQNHEYLRVRLHGVFLHQYETLVQATTDLGSGYWVLTPLRQADDSVVLINRGFVLPDRRNPAARGAPSPQGEVSITGLLRISEPAGGFLRRNDPAAGRWYSRDVQAIAALHGLTPVAPYFVDEQAAPGAEPVGEMHALPATWPVAGLTVVSFRDTHLIYAITWFVLALMVALGAGYVGRVEYVGPRGERPVPGKLEDLE